MFQHTRQTIRRVTAGLAVPRLMGTGIEVTDDAVWTWALIPASSTYLREEDDLVHATWDVTTALTTILPPGAQFHLKVLWARYSPADYTAGWQTIRSVMAPGADDYIALGERRIRRNTADGYFRRRVVLLGSVASVVTTPGPVGTGSAASSPRTTGGSSRVWVHKTGQGISPVDSNAKPTAPKPAPSKPPPPNRMSTQQATTGTSGTTSRAGRGRRLRKRPPE